MNIGRDLTNADNWNDTIVEGQRGYVPLNDFAIGFEGISNDRQRIVVNLIRGGVSMENATCDGENPSGRIQYHILSPYTLRYDIIAAITGELQTPSDIVRERNLREIIIGVEDFGGTTNVIVGFCSPENYEYLLEA